MDGMPIKDQVKLLRSVVGRKIMEIDELDQKACDTLGEEAEKYANLVSFLTNDILGYKAMVADLKDGTRDLTGNVYEIASLPADLINLYTDFYLPGLSEEDLEEEKLAMDLKSQYALDLAKAYVLLIGKTSITDPKSLELILADEELVMMIGNAVLQRAEIFNALTNQ